MRYGIASELLNTGMRLGCLQELRGYSYIEMMRRYAEVTDIIPMGENFLAMTKIQRKGVGCDNRCLYQLQQNPQALQLPTV